MNCIDLVFDCHVFGLAPANVRYLHARIQKGGWTLLPESRCSVVFVNAKLDWEKATPLRCR